jgi:hypothetical protein
MQVKDAVSRSQAEKVAAYFRRQYPIFAREIDAATVPGFSLLVGWEGQRERARSVALVPIGAAVGFDVEWLDGEHETLPVDEVESLAAVAPSLPACSGFAGTGTRCESCRVRKAVHA